MKHFIFLSYFLMLLLMTSCEIVGDIFSAGFYAGIFIVVLFVVVVIYVINRFRGRGR